MCIKNYIYRVEEDLRLHGDISEGDSTTRRGSTSARRSFFRRKKHTRSSSRDSKELASFSNTKLSWHSDSGMFIDDTVQTYQQVERFCCKQKFNFLFIIVLNI